MFIILAIMTIGITVGFIFQNKIKFIKVADKSISITIYILLFLLGLSVGSNNLIINNLGTMGLQALVLAVGAVIGSVVLMYFVNKFFFKIK